MRCAGCTVSCVMFYLACVFVVVRIVEEAGGTSVVQVDLDRDQSTVTIAGKTKEATVCLRRLDDSHVCFAKLWCLAWLFEQCSYLVVFNA